MSVGKLDTVSTRVSMEVIVTYSNKLVYKLLTGLTNLLIGVISSIYYRSLLSSC